MLAYVIFIDLIGYEQQPGNNEDILIPACLHLVIDCPIPTIRTLKIEGILEFQQVSTQKINASLIFFNFLLYH